MSGTWRHRRADRDALLQVVRSLRVTAEIPPHPEHQLLIEGQVGRLVRDWREGTLPLPPIRAVEIDDRVCGVLGGVGRAQTKWISTRLWRLLKAILRPITGASALAPQGMRAAVANLLRDLREVAASEGCATTVVFDLRGFFASQDPDRALDELDRLTGHPSHDSIALRALYRHAHETDPDLRGIVQGLATSPALAELLIRELDRALVSIGLVRRWADDIMLICGGRRDTREIIVAIESICAGVSAEQHLQLSPHGFQSAVYGPDGFETAAEFLKLRFSGLSVHVAPKKLARIDRTLAEIAAGDLDHALSCIRAIRNHYGPLLTADGFDDLALILAEDRVLGTTSPTSPSPLGAVMHVPSAAEPSSSDGSLPAGVQDTRASSGEREADARADVSRSPQKGAERRYFEILQDLDASDRDRLGHAVARGTELFRPTHFWLTTEPVHSPGGAPYPNPAPGQREILELALERAASMSHTDRRGENLTMICIDFLMTNDFRKHGDPKILARYLDRISTLLGVRILAVDAVTERLVFADPRFSLGAADFRSGPPDPSPAPDEREAAGP